MAIDINRFNKELEASTKLIIQSTEKTIKATANSMFGDIVHSTPVDLGQLRGNWQASLGAPSSKDLSGTIDRGGAVTVSNIKQVISGFKLGKQSSIFMANNLNYASTIEFGRHSAQAPRGMVRVNVAKFKAILEREANKNKV